MASFQVQLILGSPDRLPSWFSILLGSDCLKRDDETGNLECTLLIFDNLKMKLKEPGTQVVFHIFPRRIRQHLWKCCFLWLVCFYEETFKNCLNSWSLEGFVSPLRKLVLGKSTISISMSFFFFLPSLVFTNKLSHSWITIMLPLPRKF